VDSPNSTENETFNDFCSLKIIQPHHGKHLYYLVEHPYAVNKTFHQTPASGSLSKEYLAHSS